MSDVLTEENVISEERYGAKTVALEPGGVEQIPDSERHGSPLHLLWTWTTPNLEFATVGVGIIGPLYFGLSFWQSVGAIALGTLLGAISHGALSTWGPRSGLAQMVLSRTAFGYRGNILPAGLNALAGGIGWFAVNSVSGALALHALIHGLPRLVCLLFVVVAQLVVASFGHNLVHAFERWALPVLGLVFLLGAALVFSKGDFSAAHLAALRGGSNPVLTAPASTLGGFLLEAAAAFGYACGWNPYASDFTRYLPRATSRASVAVCAGFGVLVSCVVLESAGAAMVFAAQSPDVDPGVYTGLMWPWLGKLTLLCVTVGAIAANAVNIYSGAMSALAMGIRLPVRHARMVVALVFGAAGFLLAWAGLQDAGSKYENFLLIIAYWIAPWLGVVFADRLLRRGQDVTRLALDHRHASWAGPIAMLVGCVLSIWLFSNQTDYVGPVAKAHPAVGDVTAVVGFVVAAVVFVVIHLLTTRRAAAARPVTEVPA